MTNITKHLNKCQASEVSTGDGAAPPSIHPQSCRSTHEIPLAWRTCPERRAEFMALVEWLDERERRRLALAWRPILAGISSSS